MLFEDEDIINLTLVETPITALLLLKYYVKRLSELIYSNMISIYKGYFELTRSLHSSYL